MESGSRWDLAGGQVHILPHPPPPTLSQSFLRDSVNIICPEGRSLSPHTGSQVGGLHPRLTS